jgi:opacity protein-like surface antigen
MLRVILPSLLGMSSLMTPLQAAQPDFEVTPFVSYRAGGEFRDPANNDVKLEAGVVGGLAISWRTADPANQYELLYSRQATDTKHSPLVPMKIEYLQLGGTTNLGWESDWMMPFATGGFGASRFSPRLAGLSRETRWSVSLGGGMRLPVTQRFRLRFEVRGYLTWVDGKSDLFCASGCVLTAQGKSFFQYEALGGASVSF